MLRDIKAPRRIALALKRHPSMPPHSLNAAAGTYAAAADHEARSGGNPTGTRTMRPPPTPARALRRKKISTRTFRLVVSCAATSSEPPAEGRRVIAKAREQGEPRKTPKKGVNMYELIRIGSKTHYINCPARIGVYELDESGVALIDSGNDKEAGKKILKVLAEQGLHVKAVVNTHSNADHIGGNRHIQEKTGCAIYANGVETAFIRYPELEAAFLYGGFPPSDLRNKFLMAAPSEVRDCASPDFPKELEILPLEGHFFHMIGIRTPDDVVFLADCLFGENILNKYHITFIYDVRQYLATLDKVESLNARFYVPAHAEPTAEIGPLVRLNRDKVREIARTVTELCGQALCFEDILRELCRTYGITLDFNQYVLVGSTLRSYLAYLKDSGKINARFERNKLLWERAQD